LCKSRKSSHHLGKKEQKKKKEANCADPPPPLIVTMSIVSKLMLSLWKMQLLLRSFCTMFIFLTNSGKTNCP
jgi:hypothetical protein